MLCCVVRCCAVLCCEVLCCEVLCCALMRADVFSIVLWLSYYFIMYGVFPFLFPSIHFISLPPLISFTSPSSPFLSLSLLSLSVLPIFLFSPFPSSLFSLSLPSRPPYSSGTLRGDPNPVAMKEFVKILFSIYRTVVLSAYFFYFILLYYT